MDRKAYIPLLAGRKGSLLAALGIVLAAGILHGVGTDRWGRSDELQIALSRLHDLPEKVGDWQASTLEMDGSVLRQAGAEGSWLRRFTNTRTGAVVTILLLCGPTRHMAIHQPEDCYRGAGYEMAAPATPLPMREGMDVFWTARFCKPPSSGGEQLRICWSWFADDRWQAPENPRFAFAGVPVLTKLYAIRELNEPAEPAAVDACSDLLRGLVPALTRVLSSSSSTDSQHVHAN
jgi:hypothetical protein